MPTPPQFAEAATNKIHHWWLVRRWNKCACRGLSSLTLTYTTPDSGLTYTSHLVSTASIVQREVVHLFRISSVKLARRRSAAGRPRLWVYSTVAYVHSWHWWSCNLRRSQNAATRRSLLLRVARQWTVNVGGRWLQPLMAGDDTSTDRAGVPTRRVHARPPGLALVITALCWRLSRADEWSGLLVWGPLAARAVS